MNIKKHQFANAYYARVGDGKISRELRSDKDLSDQEWFNLFSKVASEQDSTEQNPQETSLIRDVSEKELLDELRRRKAQVSVAGKAI